MTTPRQRLLRNIEDPIIFNPRRVRAVIKREFRANTDVVFTYLQLLHGNPPPQQADVWLTNPDGTQKESYESREARNEFAIECARSLLHYHRNPSSPYAVPFCKAIAQQYVLWCDAQLGRGMQEDNL